MPFRTSVVVYACKPVAGGVVAVGVVGVGSIVARLPRRPWSPRPDLCFLGGQRASESVAVVTATVLYRKLSRLRVVGTSLSYRLQRR